MAILEQEILKLKERVERLEAMMQRLVGETSHGTVVAADEPLSQKQLLALLKTQGLIRQPTPEERRVAAEWEALSKAEQDAHIHLMHNLALDPSLSRIIIEQRR
jgi:hypothetical protein